MKKTTIEQFRKVVTDWTAGKVNGVTVDATTASVVVRVHDALNADNRAELAKLSVYQIVGVAWELVS